MLLVQVDVYIVIFLSFRFCLAYVDITKWRDFYLRVSSQIDSCGMFLSCGYFFAFFHFVLLHGISTVHNRSPPSTWVFEKIQIGERIMFDNTNPYTLRTETVGDVIFYYVAFTDKGIHWEVEVSQPVYAAFEQFVKTERNLHRWCERHEEWYELPEGTICDRAVDKPQSAEDAALDMLRDATLRRALHSLPVKQRRRLLLHHEFGLTYGQIAEMEGVTRRPIARSIDSATQKICEEIKKFENR